MSGYPTIDPSVKIGSAGLADGHSEITLAEKVGRAACPVCPLVL